MTAPAGLRHPALRQQDRWLSTADAVRVTGLSRGCLAEKLRKGLVHGHKPSDNPTDPWWLTYGTALLARGGADEVEQRRKCARCRYELDPPPALRGSARGRHPR